MTSRPHPFSQGTRVVVLLVVTLALAAALSYQAIDAARSQQATAEAVLRDYAAFAAEQYANRLRQMVEYYGTYPALQRLVSMDVLAADVPLPTPEALREGAGAQLSQSLDLVTQFFRLHHEREHTETAGPVTAVAIPDDTVRGHVRAFADEEWDSAALLIPIAGADPRVFFYRREQEATEVTIGFEADYAEFRKYFETALQTAPLLPVTLTDSLPNDSLLYLTVADATGRMLFRLTPYPDYPSLAPSVDYSLGERLAGLRLQVSVQPHAAGLLVIGGLPRSRLPLTVGLAVLTAGLIVVTMIQLHRERELTRLRSQFVANVSHELRTPLAQIRMFAETLLLGRVRSQRERDRSIEIIDKEARRLTTLVENVLHFSRTERQAMRLTREATHLGELVTQVVESFHPLAETRGATIVFTGTEAYADVDRGAIQQVILNLLDNALKYGPDGQTVRVEVTVAGPSARIAVTDQGPGIPPADRERIWERFSRLKRDRESAVAGTGIGLAVVKELVDLHGGRAWTEPTGEGACFVVEVPAGHRPSPEAASAASRGDRTG